MGRNNRNNSGFSLISVTLISTATLLLAGALFLQAGASRRDGISQRAGTDSFYAAETGINTLAGKLSQMGLGANAISYTNANLLVNNQSIITSLNQTQASMAAAASGGQIQAGTAYQGAVPQGIGNGLSYLIYEVNISTCQNSTYPCNSLNAPVAWDRTTIPTNVARLDVKAMGFRGRSVASNVSASIFPNVVPYLAGNKYAAFGRDYVSLGNGDTYSAMPFCSYANGVANCSVVTYMRGIYRNKLTGVITYVTDSSDASLSAALSTACPTLSSCETVSGIYKKTDGGAFFATATNLPPSGAVTWPVVDSTTGNALPLPLTPGATTGTANLAPAFPSGTVVASGGTYAMDPTYSYLPAGNIGNVGSNGTTSGGTSGVTGGSGNVVNGSVACTSTTCPPLSNPPTEGYQTIPALSFPQAPEPPSASMTCALNGSGQVVSSSSTSCPGSNGTRSIAPLAIDGSTATGSDKYPVINLTNTSGGGVSISGNSSNVLTLYSGRYVVTDLDLAGSSSLRIVQNNGDPVVLYVINSTNVAQVETLSISGNGIANTSTAGGLQIYSNTANEIKLNGNGSLRAVIYAPNGTLTLNGGGNSGYIVGTYLGQKVNFNGNNTKIVYDESLGRNKFPINTAKNISLRNWQRL